MRSTQPHADMTTATFRRAIIDAMFRIVQTVPHVAGEGPCAIDVVLRHMPTFHRRNRHDRRKKLVARLRVCSKDS